MNKEIESTLKVNNKGWMIELFETNISDVLLCAHCKSVSCNAVELGCDHADNDIHLYCNGCLTELIVQNDGKCPLNSHTDPIIVASRVSRRQISKAIVYCPFSKAHKHNEEKEGIDMAAKGEAMEGCEYKSNLSDLINNHLPECIQKVNINWLKHENRYLTEIINDKQQEIQQLSFQIKGLQNNLTAHIMQQSEQTQENRELQEENIDLNEIIDKNEEQIERQSSIINELLQIQNEPRNKIQHLMTKLADLKYMFNYKDEENDEKQIFPEKWDENLKGPSFKIEGNIIQKVMSCNDTAFMDVVAKHGVHDWFIKIENYFDKVFSIGIFNTKFDGTKMFNTCNYEPYSTYLWNINLSAKFLRDKWGLQKNGKNTIVYGHKPDVNDVIHIHLDLNKLQLSFGVNGNEFGKGWDVEKGEYRVVTTIKSKYMRLRLTKYKHTQ